MPTKSESEGKESESISPMESDARSDVNFSVPMENLIECENESELALTTHSESENSIIAKRTYVRKMIQECERLSANISRTQGHIFAIVQTMNGNNSETPECHSEVTSEFKFSGSENANSGKETSENSNSRSEMESEFPDPREEDADDRTDHRDPTRHGFIGMFSQRQRSHTKPKHLIS